ncbi:hypothetical protein [Micromonospora peucetia]|uniref:Uncharacterized protein n=1 Tax=Micromonospora peucetia TaxID=47871 RepID=A0ABZ1EJT9_9ACTN|nr:hypothetical protein [Micromonospora peucetia]WSA34529.1 hypothetical protein OIE14_11045 [Micromonospora peucetia]
MSTTTKARTARTARIAHRCDDCRRQTIAPGHRYLRHVAFPGDDVNQSNRPYTNTECVACLSGRDPAGPLLTAGACATFCHGDVPCARPLNHDGDHQCLRCLTPDSRVPDSPVETVPSRAYHDEPHHTRPVTTVHLPTADIPA